MVARALSPRLIEALAFVASHPARSEHEDDPSAYFVDFDHLEPLRTDDWQVIHGRRGTGKTLLLRQFHRESHATPGVHSCYLNLQQIALDEGPADLDSNHQREASALFGRFLLALSADLLAAYEPHDHPGQPARLADELLQSTVMIEQQASDLLSGSYARSRSLGSVNLVRQAISDAMHALRIDRLYLLLDEWSALDPTAETQIQPLFSEYLRRAFWAVDGVVLKIAGPPLQMRMALAQPNGNVVGLELDQDVQTAVDLDAIYRRGSATEMFRRILNRRLATALVAEDLRHSPLPIQRSGRQLPRLDRNFTADLFDEETFDEVAKAAEYLPRRFLNILRELQSHWYRAGQRDRFDKSFVNQVLRRSADRTMNELPRGSSMANYLIEGLRAELSTRSQRAFIVDSHDHTVTQVIKQLEGYRLVHPTSIAIERDPDRRYSVHQLDYGLWLSWSHDGHDAMPKDWFVNPNTLRSDCIDRLLVGASSRSLTDVRCPLCLSVFESAAASYARRGLCPSCFEPVPSGHTQ